jgi:hypothetical protein
MKTTKPMGCLAKTSITLVGIVGAILLLGYFLPDPPPKTAEAIAAEKAEEQAKKLAKIESGQKSLARVLAEDAIREKLKAPATAKFSGTSDTRVIQFEPNRWMVNGHVDAQNVFGAQIRSNYSVTVEFEDERDDSYRIQTVTLME